MPRAPQRDITPKTPGQGHHPKNPLCCQANRAFQSSLAAFNNPTPGNKTLTFKPILSTCSHFIHQLELLMPLQALWQSRLAQLEQGGQKGRKHHCRMCPAGRSEPKGRRFLLGPRTEILQSRAARGKAGFQSSTGTQSLQNSTGIWALHKSVGSSCAAHTTECQTALGTPSCSEFQAQPSSLGQQKLEFQSHVLREGTASACKEKPAEKFRCTELNETFYQPMS